MSIASRRMSRAGQRHRAWSMGYVAGYDQSMAPADIEWEGLTHAMVFALLPMADGTLDRTFWRGSTAAGEEWVTQLVAAAHAHGRKAFVTIGGAGTHAAFAAAVGDSTSRTALVANVLEFVDSFALDGVDIDYEPIADADVPNLILLLDELRDARPSLPLSLCSGHYNANLPQLRASDANLLALSQRVDMFNLMTYGFAYDFEGWQSWHTSPLYGHGPSTPMDTEFDVSVCVGAGIPAAKLGIGAACFGEGFLGCTAPEQAFASKVGGDGVFTYASVVSDYAPQMTRVWNDEAQEAYLWSPTPVGPHPATYVTYVDEQAMRAKAAYIADRAIGGIIFWHIAEQYLPGQPSGSRFPLLKVMAEELL